MVSLLVLSCPSSSHQLAMDVALFLLSLLLHLVYLPDS